MPKYKLKYFNGKGRAEVSRMVMKVGKVDFEDVRIPFEEWMQMKASTPFGHLPLLEVDDGRLVISESCAILRYVARQACLTGKDDDEFAQADMMVEVLFDAIQQLMKMGMEKDETKKAETKNKFLTEFLPAFLKNVEKQLKANTGASGYFVGDSMTFADVVAYHVFSTLLSHRSALLDDYPALKAHTQMMGDVPELKAWVESRPVTEH